MQVGKFSTPDSSRHQRKTGSTLLCKRPTESLHPSSLFYVDNVSFTRSKIGISRIGGGSRSRAGVSTGVSGHTGAGVDGIRVFHDGINVTPQSLLRPSTPSKTRRKASSESPPKRPSAATGGGVPARKKSSLSSDAQSSAAAAASRVDDGGGGAGGGKSPGRRRREGHVDDRRLTEEDLNALVTVGLSETPTVMLLEIRGSAVATDLREFGA